jgi:hypothetical protein
MPLYPEYFKVIGSARDYFVFRQIIGDSPRLPWITIDVVLLKEVEQPHPVAWWKFFLPRLFFWNALSRNSTAVAPTIPKAIYSCNNI